MRPPTHHFFLDRPDGPRFVVHHRPEGPARAGIVFVHAFAEEMNKSRRMAAQQARALADAGNEVLQIDLLGCGDSSGDFGDATWQDWVGDVLAAAAWLQEQCRAPLWLWGHRAGCLVAAEAAQQLTLPARVLFWQAPAQGKTLLQQFLRLRVAADLLDGRAKGLMDELKQRLAAGEAVDIAGYTLSADLARGLEQATLAPPPNPAAAVFIELSTRPDAEPTPALASAAQRWSQAGAAVRTRVVTGPAFWQTTEIEDAPALLPATVQAIAELA